MLNRLFSRIIDKRVDERLNELIKSEEIFSLRDVSDGQAKKEIKNFILEKKKEGITQLSVLDFVLKLKIPAQQVDKILEEFEKQKKIKSVYA